MPRLIIFFLFSLFLFFVLSQTGRADELEEISKKIEELSRARQMSIEATLPLEATLTKLEAELLLIQNQLKTLEADLLKKQEFLQNAQKELSAKQTQLESAIRRFYKQKNDPLFFPYSLFLSHGSNNTLLLSAYQQALIDQDKREITALVLFLTDLEQKKAQLQNDLARFKKLRALNDQEAAFFRKEIKGAKSYQAELSVEIAGLTARQQQLLAEKTGVFLTGVGEVPPADDPASRPDFDPGFRPAYAAFSFGAPHRKGLSQFGAFGRAKAGQNFEEILKHYYGNIRLETTDMPSSINTDQGSRAFEDDYLKGIAEMPARWGNEGGFEALKAQAIAARTYALSYVGWRLSNKNASGTICTSEACQVYNPARTNNPAAALWHQAVAETRGQILVSNLTSEIFASWYASTAGGYTQGYTSLGHPLPSSWDTTCGNQSCWTNEAYEKRADSPWFYKAWYKPRHAQGTRSHPWLTQEEFADIVNAVLLYIVDAGTLAHLSQTDKPNPDTWDRDRLRAELPGRGVTPVNEIKAIEVTYATAGFTAEVRLSTDQGLKTLNAQTFRKIFNLRAPGELWLASSLFNLEKK